MPRTLPFHSADADAPAVFHTNEQCEEALRISPGDWRAGGASLPPCERCARLNAENKRDDSGGAVASGSTFHPPQR